MEYVEILDENGNKTGIIKERGKINRTEEYIRAVHLWIINPYNNKILVQKRSKYKKYDPNRWDLSAGGHVRSGEESRQAIIRETKEEIGLNIEYENYFKFTQYKHNGKRSKYFFDVYILKKAVNIYDLILQESEVQEIRYFTLEELKEMYKNGQLVRQAYLHKLFDYINKDLKGENK